jgi:hypothetical protein
LRNEAKPPIPLDAGSLNLTDASVAAVPGLKTVPFATLGLQR